MALTRATEHCREGREMSELEAEDLVAGLIDHHRLPIERKAEA